MLAKDKILKVAAELFAEKGYDTVTTKAIAEAAGVSEVTVFRAFKSKRELFDEVFSQGMRPFRVHTYLKNDATYDLKTDLTHMAGLMLQTMEKNMPLMRMILKDGHPSKQKKEFRGQEKSAKGCVRKYFATMHQQGKISAEPDMAAQFFMLNINSVLHATLYHGKEKVDRKYFDWMVDKVIDVIK